ncbi:MAG: hypothetical protein LJF04_16190 [Gemmatimonadetes bacterium]|nr:hypothetical protein [Gemmatimonadota bacterium]
MYPMGGLEILFLALAISIVIKPLSRAATEIVRARSEGHKQAMDGESRERIEALEERVRFLEERQDFTDKLLSGRREPRPGLPEGPSSKPLDDTGGTGTTT